MMLFGFVLLFGCHAVSGDAILGRDLAAADEQFAAVPPDARLAYAPVPGSLRTLAVPELKRIAARFGVSGEFRDVCFEFPMRHLESSEIMQALRSGLGIEGAEIEIAEFSLFAAPKGDIVFPRATLSRPSPVHPEEPVMWRGYVNYSGDRRFTIWARVRVRAPQTEVVAAEDLAPGRPVRSSQLRLETLNGFPSLQPVAGSLEQVAGHTLRRAIRSGAAVPLDSLDGEALDVNRGDAVTVEVDAGQAHLKFEGRAESCGETGDSVMIRNARSGKMFSARVVGKGKVAVVSQ